MPKLTERELQERVEILEARVQARETVIEQQRAVIRKQEIQSDKHDEWYESIQRQLKKRYDQIHELTIDLKNANDKLQWYAQNQESHAKTVALGQYNQLMIERDNLNADFQILAKTYNDLCESHNELKNERDQIVEIYQQPINATNSKTTRLEEILQDIGLVREPGGWVHPKHVVNHKKRRLTPAESDMLIQNCCSRIESIHILVEKVQDLYEHVNDPKPYEFIETHYKVL